MGRAIVKRYVDACNGTIALTSRVGTGTTFTIKLPLDCSIATLPQSNH